MKKLILCVLVSFGLLFSQGIMAENLPKDQSLTAMLSKVMPAVVNVRVQRKAPPFLHFRRDDARKSPKFMSIGSGVIIDAKKGFILTNAHVVKDAKTITITLKDGRKFVGKLIGADTASDVAVIQIKAQRLTSIKLADSNKIQVGSFVAAIGSPFGLDQTVTSGIVSALGRSNIQSGHFEDFIQTDAPINVGNSGGALVNPEGKLVGINTAIIAPDGGSVGIGFAIPANTAKAILDQLITFGNVERGYMGLLAQDLTPDLADALNIKQEKGALIAGVNQISPAANASLKVGQVVVAVNDIPVDSASSLISNVGMLRAGSRVDLTVLDQDQKKTVKVPLVAFEQLENAREKTNPYFYGLTLRSYSEMNPNLGYVQGVQIIGVAEDSNASRDGLVPGDVIISVNLRKVTQLAELLQMVNKSKQKPLLLNVLRKSGAFFIRLDPTSHISPSNKVSA